MNRRARNKFRAAQLIPGVSAALSGKEVRSSVRAATRQDDRFDGRSCSAAQLVRRHAPTRTQSRNRRTFLQGTGKHTVASASPMAKKGGPMSETIQGFLAAPLKRELSQRLRNTLESVGSSFESDYRNLGDEGGSRSCGRIGARSRCGGCLAVIVLSSFKFHPRCRRVSSGSTVEEVPSSVAPPPCRAARPIRP